MSAFSVVVTTDAAVDLTVGALAAEVDRWIHPTDYSATQQLAGEARNLRVAAIRAPSARNLGGINVAVLEPGALVPPPKPHSSWAFMASNEGLIATREMGGTTLRIQLMTGHS
jgi:hypothetical protein